MSFIIAEIGTSHEGSLSKAKALIDLAYNAGCDAVKFQWVYANEILHPLTGLVNLPTGSIPLYDRFKNLECPLSFYKECMDYAHSLNLKWGCSPFGLRSLKELLSLDCDFIKIASPELNHYPMLDSLASYRKREVQEGKKPIDVIISSGVSTLSDIEKALSILGLQGVTLLHCVTSYPAPEDEYNLRLIRNLSDIFGVNTGLSDHSLDPILVPALSILMGATVIEKHITLSRETDGLDDPVALDGEKFGLMCHVIHQSEACLRRYGEERGSSEMIKQLEESYDEDLIEKVLGSGIKSLAPSEKANYGRTNRSIHFVSSLNKGETIKEEDVAILRTEKVLTPGLSPEMYDLVIGKKVIKDASSGEGLTFEHLF